MNDDIAVIGMPFDACSSFLRGPAEAPPLIREAIVSDSANSFTELGIDLAAQQGVRHYDDVKWNDDSEAFGALQVALSEVLDDGLRPITLGGDHSITYPILEALSAHHEKITILQFDAHPDLHNIFEGNPLSHACPFARIMENDLADHLIQVGIRTLTVHQAEQAERFNVEIHQMRHWQGPEQLNIQGPLYITIDLDGLDPAYAPGVSHHEPGGLSTRQVIDVIHSVDVPIIGADIVEYNPRRDLNGVTAMVAAKLYKEVLGKMLCC